MCPDHDPYAIVTELFRSLSYVDVIVVVVRRLWSTHASRFYKLLGRIPHKPLIEPNIGPVVPILFTHEAAVGHNEGRHVACAHLRPKLDNVIVDVSNRQ